MEESTGFLGMLIIRKKQGPEHLPLFGDPSIVTEIACALCAVVIVATVERTTASHARHFCDILTVRRIYLACAAMTLVPSLTGFQIYDTNGSSVERIAAGSYFIIAVRGNASRPVCWIALLLTLGWFLNYHNSSGQSFHFLLDVIKTLPILVIVGSYWVKQWFDVYARVLAPDGTHYMALVWCTAFDLTQQAFLRHRFLG